MKVLIESVKIRMQISSQKAEFEKDCIGEAKIYIFFYQTWFFLFTGRASLEKAGEPQNFPALIENQYYIKKQLDFSQVAAWMHRVKQSVVKRLDRLFDDVAVLIYQINPN